MLPDIPIEQFYAAYEIISPHLHLTSCTAVETSKLYIKWENQQITGSFKARGAFNKILQTDAVIRERGVIAASAGNHGQGVALAGKETNTPVTVYTYQGAPQIKIRAMEDYGAEVIVVEGNYRDAEKIALQTAEQQGKLYVSPYNDQEIMIGQGTLAIEACTQLTTGFKFDGFSDTDWFIPLSGGGLLAGMAIVIRQIAPGARVIGVQPENSPFMHQIFYKGTQDHVISAPTIADSLDGAIDDQSITIPHIKKNVDAIQLVSEEAMKDAVSYAWHTFGQRIEPSGAISIAAARLHQTTGRKLIAIVSGGNIQQDLFNEIIMNDGK